MKDQLIILNFDSSYAAALASKLRAERISARILPGSTSAEQIMNEGVLGVILSGGTGGDLPGDLDGNLLRYGIPLLALGSAAPAVTALMGGTVGEPLPVNDVDTLFFEPSRITNGLTESERLFGTIHELGLGADLQTLALYQGRPVGFAHQKLPIFAIDCQLEPNDPDMMSLMMQFATDVCGCTRWWGEDAFISAARAQIVEAAGGGRALCVMSGGLDSGVCAMLAHRALGDRLTCLFVDTGLLRENDVLEFSSYYKGAGLNLMVVNAEDRVLEALQGLTSQEDKRVALRGVLSDILNETARGLDYGLLVDAQTSDYLFTGAVTPPQQNLVLEAQRIIAPLGDLFKSEVRQVGEALGLPPEITAMQPFPWTGLALRIIGECTQDRLSLLRWADARFRHEINEAGLNKRLWKYFALLYDLPQQGTDKSIVIGLRAVSISHIGSDLRALPARLPYDLLERYTQQVMAHDERVNKVIYDLTPGQGLQETEWQ
ncbi:MAG: hypothetical protein GXY84_07290 [Clostridiales bacterium]|nr:hypothetical protein [Clostridiales bacterium]